MRAAVVILEDGRIALIERARDGRTYFVFPGSGVETGESPEEAAATATRNDTMRRAPQAGRSA